MSSNVGREIEIDKNKGSSGWATAMTFEKEVAVGAQGQCEIILRVKILVIPCRPIHNNMLSLQHLIPG